MTTTATTSVSRRDLVLAALETTPDGLTRDEVAEVAGTTPCYASTLLGSLVREGLALRQGGHQFGVRWLAVRLGGEQRARRSGVDMHAAFKRLGKLGAERAKCELRILEIDASIEAIKDVLGAE